MTDNTPKTISVKPSASQPGTMDQQWLAIVLFHSDPTRHRDRQKAWQVAREKAIPHATPGDN